MAAPHYCRNVSEAPIFAKEALQAVGRLRPLDVETNVQFETQVKDTSLHVLSVASSKVLNALARPHVELKSLKICCDTDTTGSLRMTYPAHTASEL